MEKFLAVSGDGFVRMFGQGERGAGHAVLIPAGSQGDPVGGSGARIVRACGSSFPAEKASEKFQGDKRCPKCVEWLATADGTAAIERARAERHAWEFGADDMAELFSVADVVNGTDVREDSATVTPDEIAKDAAAAGDPVSKRAAAVKRERKRLADQRERREAAREAAGSETVGVTGLTHAEMREAVERYYANGGAVPAEIASLPAPGTVNLASGTVSGSAAEILVCEYKGDVETINPERTHGKCPECSAYIPLQDVKSDPDAQRIGKHNAGGVASPASKGMSSRSIETVEHGSIPGDPAAADKRRRAESLCDKSGKVARGAQGGTKECTGCARPVELREVKRTVKGEVKVSYRYPDHVRPGDSFARGATGERKVTPRGSGADAGKGQRDHGSVNGSATTGSQNMAPVQPKGWTGTAGTMSLPAMVRPGIDPEVVGDICPLPECDGQRKDVAHKGKSVGWRRRHSSKVGAYLRGRKEERDAKRAAQIESGEIVPASVKREARKAASVGSFAEGTVAGSVAHGTRPEFAPKGTRKPAPNRKDGVKHTRRSGRAA